MKEYKPKVGSFPYKTISYLEENGESKVSDIRREIGLDEWCKKSWYSDRSSYYFDCLIGRLQKKGIVNRTKRGYYELNK